MTKLMPTLIAALLIAGAPFATLADAQEEQPEKEAAAAATKAVEAKEAPVKADVQDVRFQKPILLTSAGQSVDIKLAGVLLKRLKIEFDSKPRAVPADLEGIKTLVVVPGYSSKGLGSAGVSRDEEMKRVEELLAAAAKSKIPVLAMHLGGNARRGVQSDDFNAAVVKASDLAIVVAQGDEDGFFTELCREAKVPLKIVEIIADAMKPLEESFKPMEDAVSEK
jgi:hypothetical protein